VDDDDAGVIPRDVDFNKDGSGSAGAGQAVVELFAR
jgi:hypothetical protein